MVNYVSSSLTVVVPVHKMAGRLGLLMGWLSEIEQHRLSTKVVIVEDGMDYETLAQLEQVRKFPFVEILSGVFDSPGLARNYGLSLVRTEWVAFWDSDDTPNPTLIQKELDRVPIEKTVLIGAFQTLNTQANTKTSIHVPKNLNSVALNPGLWRFVFRKSRLGSIKFTLHRMGEDQVFLSALNLRGHECEFSDSLFYSYTLGNSSQLTQSGEAIKEIRATIFEFINVIRKQNGQVANYSLIMFFKILLTGLKVYAVKPLDVFVIVAKSFWTSPRLLMRLLTISLFVFRNSLYRRGI